jgi:hypothetical protein
MEESCYDFGRLIADPPSFQDTECFRLGICSIGSAVGGLELRTVSLSASELDDEVGICGWTLSNRLHILSFGFSYCPLLNYCCSTLLYGHQADLEVIRLHG